MLPLNIKQINQWTINAYLNEADSYHQRFNHVLSKNPFEQYLLDQVSESLSDDSIICDAGCGPSAQLSRYLSAKGNRVVAADISPRVIEMVREHSFLEDYKVTDMRRSSFDTNSFDAIVARHCFNHTPKDLCYQFIREMKSLLRPNGKLLIMLPYGKEEGILQDSWWGKNSIYQTQFLENDLLQWAADYSLQVDLLEKKKSFVLEEKQECLYMLCTKKME